MQNEKGKHLINSSSTSIDTKFSTLTNSIRRLVIHYIMLIQMQICTNTYALRYNLKSTNYQRNPWFQFHGETEGFNFPFTGVQFRWWEFYSVHLDSKLSDHADEATFLVFNFRLTTTDTFRNIWIKLYRKLKERAVKVQIYKWIPSLMT